MLFAFVTVYKTDDDVWVSSPAAIATHYLKGWFIVDLISIGVSGIDVYVIASEATAFSLARVSVRSPLSSGTGFATRLFVLGS